MNEMWKSIIIVGITILGIAIFYGFVIIIEKRGEENIVRFWKIIKYEFIVGIFINILLWAVNSIKLQTIKNVSEFVIITLIIFFSMSALGWNHLREIDYD